MRLSKKFGFQICTRDVAYKFALVRNAEVYGDGSWYEIQNFLASQMNWNKREPVHQHVIVQTTSVASYDESTRRRSTSVIVSESRNVRDF
jgi:hypothetical protein